MVTGANAGIGKETVIGLARQSATVVMVARNPEKGEAARAQIIASTGNNNIHLLIADMSSRQSIENMVLDFRARFDRLNVLVNNAGVFLMNREESAERLELTFATNHLGYFITTLLLWDSLRAGSPSRVINVSSDAHRQAKLNFDDLQNRKHYRGFQAYSQSKLANVLFTYELNRRREGAGITVNALHPGFVASNFGRNNAGMVGFAMKKIVPWIARSEAEGATTPLYLATSEEVAEISGKYYVKCAPVHSSAASYDLKTAEQLWTVSEAITGLSLPTPLDQTTD